MRARVPSECALEIPSAGPIDEEATEAAPVVGMHLDGSLPPLYLIRTWADEIFKQRRLAQHLGPEQPIYSIAPPGGTRKSDYPDTVDAWAELCLQRLSPVLRGGPYVLGGWSFGGVIALELAEKLVARGEKVRLITMLDTRLPARHPYTTKGKRKVTKLHKFSKHLTQYVELPSRRERGAFLRKRIRRRFEKWGKKL